VLVDGRDHVRRAIRHYLERDEDLTENPEDPGRLNRSVRAAFTLARAAVAAARDLRDMVLRLPPREEGRPSPLHRHYEAVWVFLSALWELIDFCELEQEVASSDVEDPVWFFGRALDQNLGGNPFEALTILDEAGLSEGHEDPWIQMLRAETLAGTGDAASAVRAWETSTTLDPLLVPAHVAAAGELENMGQDRDALSHWLAVAKATAKDDPVAGEARRHLVRLGQRLRKTATAEPGERFGSLPRWGPSWIPSWPGRGMSAAGPEATAGDAPPATPSGPPENPSVASADEPGVPAADRPAEAELGGTRPAAVSSLSIRGPVRAGKLQALLGLSDAADEEVRVMVIGDDPVADEVLRTRSAVYHGGGLLVGEGASDVADVEHGRPDLVVLVGGVSMEFCASLAERTRSGRLRSRRGEVEFAFNGPEEARADLEAIFEGLPLTFLPDIRPPAAADIDEATDVEELLASVTRGQADSAANGQAEAAAATTRAVRDRVSRRRGGADAPRRSLALGLGGVAPVLEWLDGGEVRTTGRRPPYDLLAAFAEPEAVETLALRCGEVHGATFGPEGQERGRLLDDLFEEVPRVMPVGDTALLMGRLLGGGGSAAVPTGPEAFVAASLTAGVLKKAVRTLRQVLATETFYGLRSRHLLVGGSLLSRLPNPEYALLAAVDGCQPTGVTRVMLDPYGIVATLGDGLRAGKLTAEAPSLADGTAALLAGSCICVAPLVQAVKWGRPGRRPVMEVSIKGAWRDGERKWELSRGELRWIPLPAGRRIELLVRPAEPYSVGRGRGVEVRGDFVAGGLGLLLDGRGRPLRLPEDEGGRTALRAAWASELIGPSLGRKAGLA